MNRHQTVQKLEQIRRFLGRIGRNETLANTTDPELNHIHIKAKSFELALADAIRHVHQHWEKKGY